MPLGFAMAAARTAQSRPGSSPAARDIRVRYVVKSRHAQALEEIAQLYTAPPDIEILPDFVADATRFAENFTSHADGFRYVHDLSKDEHVDFLRKLMSNDVRRTWQVNDAAYAISEDGFNAFTLHDFTVGDHPLTLVLRLKVNEHGKVEDQWRKRGLLPHEIDTLLNKPAKVRPRLEGLPHLQKMESAAHDPVREAKMMVAVDRYFREFCLHCAARDEDRWDRIIDFTTDDFQEWDATGVWNWPSGYSGVLDRDGLIHEIDFLQDHLGTPSGAGRTHAVLRAEACNSARNIAFLHFDLVGSAKDKPYAMDIMVVFTFSGGSDPKIRQAMKLRSACSLQEYAATFKMANELSQWLT